MKTKSIRVIFVGLVLSQIITGCIIGADAATREVLEDAIDELGKQPERWGDELTDAMKELDEIGTNMAKTVRAEIQSLYNQSLQTTQEASFCGADFIGIRVNQIVQDILHKHFPDSPSPSFFPIICTVDPNVINSDSTSQILYSGFDFISFGNTGIFSADLVYSDTKEIIQPNFGGVSVQTNYKIIVDIQGSDFSGLNGNRRPQLVLRWSNQAVSGKSEVPINIIPTPTPPPPTYTYQFDLATQNQDDASGSGDCRVWITVYGTKGQTEEIEILGDFERNEVETGIISHEDLGEIFQIKVKYFDPDNNNAWHLAWIKVTNISTTQIRWFPCDVWLGHQNPTEVMCTEY